LWLRLNRRKETLRTLEQISASGFSVERHPLAPDAIKLVPPSTITSLTAFKQGGISVQDPAAQLAAELLDARGHHRVLDACAAPGGKSCHILENAPGVTLTILDQSPARLERVSANLERLGLDDDEHVQLIAADAARPETWWEGIQYDRILLDAPCSATGVIRRHPEIKWLRSSKQVEKAVLLQARLMKSLWPLLNTGGILLYATCSVLKAENINQIQSFMKCNPDAEIIGIENDWGQESHYGRQILPGELEMDGFFYARLRKNP
jgi:16S rRNA (cytosine967-C5)-methyltransferase